MRKPLVLLGWIVLGLIGPAVFLALEWSGGLAGFPLDDSWIHQTYARSLAAGQGWAYAGIPASGGSTSPLWTMLQAPAYWFHIPPVAWSSALGMVLLLSNGALIMFWIRRIHPTASRYAFLLCVGEWHLVWAALSGMETILFCTWISAAVYVFFPMGRVIRRADAPVRNTFLLGLLAGIGLWIRPEAILLSGLILPAAILQEKPIFSKRAVRFILGFLPPILAFFSFEFSLTGRLLPNTFFVKTAEYSILTSESFVLRLLRIGPPLLAGLGAVLILFVPAAIGSLLRERKFLGVLPALWAMGHIILYAAQLPATYQHSRYFLPVLPVLIGYGVYGYTVLRRKVDTLRPFRILLRAFGMSAAALTVVFLWIGARQFTRDIAAIDEMAVMARWIRDHTPPDTVVAAHDIGALGFWGERRIVDLGGVTDLDALPLLRGTVPLREYLAQKNADLLMSMWVFYPSELNSCTPVGGSPNGGSADDTGFRTLLYDWRTGCDW
jgi:hypothetical protein